MSQMKIGSDVLGKDTVARLPPIRPIAGERKIKVRSDYWTTIPAIVRSALAIPGEIEVEVGGKVFKVKVDRYGSMYINKEMREQANIAPGMEFDVTVVSPTKITLVSPSLPPPPTVIPPAPTAVGQKIAQERMKDVDWSTVEMIQTPEAEHLPSLIEDYYNYDRGLQHPDKPTLFLVGPPGVGKSVSVYEAAERLAKQRGATLIPYSDEIAPDLLKDPSKYEDYFLFVDLRLTEVEPQDLMGIPVKKTIAGREVMDYSPPLWAVCLSKIPGILFLDEITNVQRSDVISAAYKIALEKRVGFTNFHPETMVITAGNPPEVSGIAQQLPAPLVNRMIRIEVSRPSIESWAKWMNEKYGDGWDRRVYAYLSRPEFSEDFLRPPKEGMTLENFPTPRAWTKVAIMLPHIDPRNAEILLRGYLGDTVASKFLSFIKTKPPELEELLNDPKKWDTLNLDAKWLSLVSLSARIKEDIRAGNDKNLDRYIDLIDAIDKDRAEYIAGLCSMIGTEDLQRMIVLVLKTRGTAGLNKLSNSFKKRAEVKKILEEITA